MAAADGEAGVERVIRPRHPRYEFGDVPRYWMANSAVATQLVNGVNLLFPAGERFFVRSVGRYLDRVEDPALRVLVKGFAGQEGRHAKAHEDYFDVMRGHGYDVDGFLRWYERVAYGGIEKVSPAVLSLSVTVALEHFTALLAEGALRDGVLDLAAHPDMVKLLKWHAVEEIEHRAVAFDVLRAVDPRYSVRVAGLVMAVTTLGGFWAAATLYLLAQDTGRGRAPSLEDARVVGSHPKSLLRDVFVRGIREYLRRDFHPLDRPELDDYAREYIAQAGLDPAPHSPG